MIWLFVVCGAIVVSCAMATVVAIVERAVAWYQEAKGRVSSMPSSVCVSCYGSLKIRPCAGCHRSVCVLCATVRRRGKTTDSFCTKCAKKLVGR